MKQATPAPSWWVDLPRAEFTREALRRAAAMSAKGDPPFTLNLRRKPKPEGNRASVQTEAA